MKHKGGAGLDVFAIARAEVEKSLGAAQAQLKKQPEGLTVVLLVGVNGTGKTTTAAKLAHMVQGQGQSAMLAACDTFRAAAVEQLKLWGERLKIPVICGAQGADPAAVAHDAIAAALARRADYLFIDTAGRLHTKHNLMQELQKVHRILHKKLPGAPHETLLVLDASTGMNALTQAREFNKAVPITGLVITKLDGTSKGGMVVAIQKELGLPIKFIGLGEKLEDLQPFDASAIRPGAVRGVINSHEQANQSSCCRHSCNALVTVNLACGCKTDGWIRRYQRNQHSFPVCGGRNVH